MTRLTMAARAGLPPGTIDLGPSDGPPTRISVMDYDQDHLRQTESADPASLAEERGKPGVTWFQVEGVHQGQVIQRLGDIFGLHPLLLEDVTATVQRPKLEDFEDYLFAVLRTLEYRPGQGLSSEQVSLVLGRGWLLSFQESDTPVFAGVRERITRGAGRIRRLGVDYLGYVLMDAIVDRYFVALEAMGEAVEDLEDELTDNPGPECLPRLHQLKREALAFRRAVWPLREVVSALGREHSSLITAEVQPFVRDLYDHVIQVIDQVENQREVLAGMVDLYLSMVSNRMNEVMKVLTIMATLFIPLTFVVGVYGMNFEFMPELKWRWGYPAVMGLMAALVVGMLIYFRKRRWL